jgi:hypothetical protein
VCNRMIGSSAMFAAYAARSSNASESAARTDAGVQEALPSQVSITELVGLDEQRADKLLGPALSTENRPPASVWHYKSSRCDLDLIFYMEMRTGTMRTLHYEFKRAENAEEQQACLTTILQERNGPTDPLPGQKLMAESSAQPASEPARAHPAVTLKWPTWHQQPTVKQRRYAREYTASTRRSSPQLGYIMMLRSSRVGSRDAGFTTGWGGGQFGPAPYSSSN